jgi:acyl-CoA reductase-like NAD-dependent aldehyde dehydrogenase
MSEPLTSEHVIRSVSPQNPSDVIGEYPECGAADVALAAATARAAQREWVGLGAAKRSAALVAIATELRGRADEAVALVVREVGKPLGEAKGEVARAVSIVEFYAQAAFAQVGSLYPPSLSGLLYTERRPHGVAGLITPWNFPLAIPLWKAAPALIAGNAVVLKPSPDATACAELLGEIMSHHLPAGVFTVTPGGSEAGEAVVASCDVVSFTGSAAVGRAVSVAAATRGIPVQCEMGGQNAAIVLSDADPAATAALIAGAAMGYAGQKCTATRRVIVVGEHPDFIRELSASVTRLAPVDPADPGAVVGPVINDRARHAVSSAIELAVADGAAVLAGGNPVDGDGFFVEPTLIDGLPPDHPLCREETFGPLAIVVHAPDLEVAVEVSNSVAYGLVTSIHGRDLDQILTAIKGVDSGLIKVNAPTTGVDFYAPFGGEKDSSQGPREQGMAALDFYGTTRTVTIAPHGA